MKAGDDRIKLVDPTQQDASGASVAVHLKPEKFSYGEGKDRQDVDTNQLITSGRYQADPTELYDIRDELGNTHTVKGTDLATNLSNGFRLETYQESIDRHNAQDQAKEDEQNKMSTAEAVAAGVGQGATFGALSKLVPGGEATMAQAEREHPTATTIGELGGGVAGAELTGLAGLAARIGKGTQAAAKGASLASRALAPVLGGATEGAVLAAPVAGRELVQGDPEQAAEALLFGLGAGSAFGALGAGIKAIAGASEKALGSVAEGVNADTLVHPDIEEDVLKSAAKKVEDTHPKGGKQALDDFALAHKDLLQEADGSYTKLASKVSEVHDTDAQALEDFYSRIGDQQKRLVQDGIKSDLLPTADELEAQLVRSAKDPEVKQALKDAVGSTVDTDFTGRLDPQKLWEVKQNVARYAAEDSQFLKPRKVLEQQLDDIAGELGPESQQQHQQLVNAFRVSDRALKVVQRSADAEVASQPKSVMDYVKAIKHGAHISSHDVGLHVIAHMVGLGPVVGAYQVAQKAVGIGKSLIREHLNPLQMAQYGNRIGDAITDAAGSNASQRIGATVSKFTQATRKAAPVGIASALRQFNGGGPTSAPAAFAVANDEIQKMQQPGYIERKLEPQLRDVRNGRPEVAQAYIDKVRQGATYLASVLPKPTRVPEPFNPRPWVPTQDVMKDFARRLEVVNDPSIIATRFRDGTLKPAHVEALDAVYPRTSKLIKQQLLQEAMASTKRMSASRRTKLAHLLVEPGSALAAQQTSDLVSLQQTLDGPAAQQQGGGQSKGSGWNPSKLKGTPGALGPKGEGLTQSQKLEFM